MSDSYVNVEVSHGAIVINLEDTYENWTDLTVDEARDLAERLKKAASECEKEGVVSIIRDAVSQIHAERYGMTVREHEELDKVLRAMNGYLDYVAKKEGDRYARG